MKRKLRDITREIRELRLAFHKRWGNWPERYGKWSRFLMSRDKLEDYLQLEWLRGYLQAAKDERVKNVRANETKTRREKPLYTTKRTRGPSSVGETYKVRRKLIRDLQASHGKSPKGD